MPYSTQTVPTSAGNAELGREPADHANEGPVGLATLLLRVSLGVVFVGHAGLKLFSYTLPGTAAFFAANGFPAWSAYAVFAAELLGGLALILGLGTRWAALALVPVMLGALTVHWPNGWSFTAPEGGWEYVAFLLAALVVQAGLGDGSLSLSRRLGRRDISSSYTPLSSATSRG